MQSMPFEQAVMKIHERHPEIAPQAYLILKEALDHALKTAQESNTHDGGHVSAQQLLFGLRDYALEEYGPMAMTLFEEWGVTKTADIGTMVFGLIEEGMFGRQDSDTQSDFDDIFDFYEVFEAPFLPSSQLRQSA